MKVELGGHASASCTIVTLLGYQKSEVKSTVWMLIRSHTDRMKFFMSRRELTRLLLPCKCQLITVDRSIRGSVQQPTSPSVTNEAQFTRGCLLEI